jgi:UDP-N-acetylmuramate dehydrogenase
MQILKDQPLFSHTTMKLGGKAKYLVFINNESELIEALNYVNNNNLAFIVLGSGSNIIFGDKGFDGLVIINQIKGFEINSDSGEAWANSGESWDDFVLMTIEKSLYGIEALSLIPGTVGASPVNNIGAYGQEVSQSIKLVRAYDTIDNCFKNLSAIECNFGYRSSLFKNEQYGRFVITKVYFKLKKTDNDYKPPQYDSLLKALSNNEISHPTPIDVRNVVIDIRSAKLPDPSVIANTGSFFKNPIVDKEIKEALLSEYPDLIYFEHNNKYKLAAGWLIDKAGLKGYAKEGIRVYDKQALVLVNEGTRSYQALENMKNYIQAKIYEKYGVMLEPEPEIIV